MWMRGRRMVNNTYELRLILNALPAKQIFLVALLNFGGQVRILRPNPLVLICIRRRFNKLKKISRPMRFLGTNYRETVMIQRDDFMRIVTSKEPLSGVLIKIVKGKVVLNPYSIFVGLGRVKHLGF